MWRRGFVPVALVAALAAVMFAPSVERPTSVRFVGISAPSSYEMVAAAAPRDLIRLVAAVLADALGLPLPPTVVLRLYATRDALEEGLVRDAGVAPRVAVELVGTALGLALPRTVLLLTADNPDGRVRLVAHEVMHLIQLELAGPTARPAQWLMEGTAEWAALTVLDHLGAAGVMALRRAVRIAARAYLDTHTDFIPASVRRPADFRRWQRRTGDVLAYQVAHALAERLVHRHGVTGVVAYFREFRKGLDAGTNFERVFAMSTAAFMADVRSAIRTGSECAECAPRRGREIPGGLPAIAQREAMQEPPSAGVTPSLAEP
jgi:hypothetical protein